MAGHDPFQMNVRGTTEGSANRSGENGRLRTNAALVGDSTMTSRMTGHVAGQVSAQGRVASCQPKRMSRAVMGLPSDHWRPDLRTNVMRSPLREIRPLA